MQQKNQLLQQLREFRMAQQKQKQEAEEKKKTAKKGAYQQQKGTPSGGSGGTDEKGIKLFGQTIHSSSRSQSSNKELKEMTRSTGSDATKHAEASHPSGLDLAEKSPARGGKLIAEGKKISEAGGEKEQKREKNISAMNEHVVEQQSETGKSASFKSGLENETEGQLPLSKLLTMIMKTSLVGQSSSALSANTENIEGFETGPIVSEKSKKSLLGSEHKISSPKSFSPRNQDRLKKDGEEKYRSLQNILNSSDRSESKSKSFHQSASGIVVSVNRLTRYLADFICNFIVTIPLSI